MKPTLDQLLARWRPEAPDNSRLEQEVWRRIGRADSHPLQRWGFAFLAAACIAGALIFGQWRVARERQKMSAELVRQYLQLIDPLLEARGKSVDAELAWIRTDLKLTPEQFQRIKELHAQSMREFLALNQQAAQARQDFARLEQLRQTADQVDFLAFARLTDTQNAINHRSLDSTRKLVWATAEVMTPEQRQRYLLYVRPALAGGSPSLHN